MKNTDSQVEEKGDSSEQEPSFVIPRGALVSKASIKCAPSTTGLSGRLSMLPPKIDYCFKNLCGLHIKVTRTFSCLVIHKEEQMTLNKTRQACMPIINTSSIQIPNWSCLEVIFFLPPSYRQISSKWQTTLSHTLTSSKMHGTTCL